METAPLLAKFCHLSGNLPDPSGLPPIPSPLVFPRPLCTSPAHPHSCAHTAEARDCSASGLKPAGLPGTSPSCHPTPAALQPPASFLPPPHSRPDPCVRRSLPTAAPSCCLSGGTTCSAVTAILRLAQLLSPPVPRPRPWGEFPTTGPAGRPRPSHDSLRRRPFSATRP